MDGPTRFYSWASLDQDYNSGSTRSTILNPKSKSSALMDIWYHNTTTKVFEETTQQKQPKRISRLPSNNGTTKTYVNWRSYGICSLKTSRTNHVIAAMIFWLFWKQKQFYSKDSQDCHLIVRIRPKLTSEIFQATNSNSFIYLKSFKWLLGRLKRMLHKVEKI